MKLRTAVYLCFLVASIPVFLILTSREEIDLFGNIAQLTGLLFAGFSFLQVWEQAGEPKVKRAGFLIAVGMAIWAVGQIMVTYSELLLQQSPYGTVSSNFFVIGNLLCLAAVLSLVKHSFKAVAGKPIRRNYILQASILAFLLFVAVIRLDWSLLTDPDRKLVWKILDLLYPLFDVAILGLTLYLVRIARLRKDNNAIKGYALFCLAFLSIGLADVVALDVDFENTLYRAADMIYFSAYFLIAFSAYFLAHTTPET